MQISALVLLAAPLASALQVGLAPTTTPRAAVSMVGREKKIPVKYAALTPPPRSV